MFSDDLGFLDSQIISHIFAVYPALFSRSHSLNCVNALIVMMCANVPFYAMLGRGLRVLAASLPRVTRNQVKNVQMIYGILNRLSNRTCPSLVCGPCESRITSGTVSQVLRSLMVEGKDYLDIVPSMESLFCAAALGANTACGLGYPADWGSWENAKAEISHAVGLSAQLTSVQWYDQEILDLREMTCPFCDLSVIPFYNDQNQWAVLAFWERLPKIKQDHILSLCSSPSSYVTSLAVCKDNNWKSEAAGNLAKLAVLL